MVAARLADVDDLNRRARHALRDEGYLGDDQVVLAGRGFADGDDVLALRNDYQLGLLNGTRAIVERIDTTRHAADPRHRRPASSWPSRSRTPRPATSPTATPPPSTRPKAPPSTAASSSLDDTTTREHAYTALSRGRHGNDLFVVAEDRRVDERHAAEIERDPLDDVRQAIGRSAAQAHGPRRHRAAADVDARPAPTGTRRCSAGRLGDGPPDPSWEYRRLSEALARETALPRRSAVAARHRTQGAPATSARSAAAPTEPSADELERRIAGFETDIARHDEKLADLEAKLTELTPEMLTRAHGSVNTAPSSTASTRSTVRSRGTRASNESSPASWNAGWNSAAASTMALSCSPPAPADSRSRRVFAETAARTGQEHEGHRLHERRPGL